MQPGERLQRPYFHPSINLHTTFYAGLTHESTCLFLALMKSGLNKATSTAKATDSFAFTAVEELQQAGVFFFPDSLFTYLFSRDLLTALPRIHLNKVQRLQNRETVSWIVRVDSGKFLFQPFGVDWPNQQPPHARTHTHTQSTSEDPVTDTPTRRAANHLNCDRHTHPTNDFTQFNKSMKKKKVQRTALKSKEL